MIQKLVLFIFKSLQMLFWDYILKRINEEIENVIIGYYGQYHFLSSIEEDSEDDPEGGCVPKDKRNILLKAEDAKTYLSYEYDPGFGSPKCHAVYIWTKSSVYFIVQYDGSTSLQSVPRNPCNESPIILGQ